MNISKWGEKAAICLIFCFIGGMLLAALSPVSNHNEFRVVTELMQIEQAIEKFRIEFGFYPPSFVLLRNSGSPADAMKPFVDMISPENKEYSGEPGSRPIDVWWRQVGCEIEPEQGDDVVFWLSKISKNESYPLTGSNADSPIAEKWMFYDFHGGQLKVNGSHPHYIQSSGAEVPFLYIDAKSYGIYYRFCGYFNGVDSNGNRRYENPDSFQLFTYGKDGRPGLIGDWRKAGPDGEDNICNFSEGQLDRLIHNAVDSTSR